MALIGVVCEYNPFHPGHLAHLRSCREALGEESPVLCVMSGDFVQRGEAAVYDKFLRAEAACRCGASLVLELPLPWCISSAEGFARGAVSLLGAWGASCLCFGSESGELEPLETLAEALLEPGLQEEIRQLLKGEATLSYAAARERVLTRRLGEKAALLRQPNDILAVEYLKAVRELGLGMEALPILRRGAGHDREEDGEGPCSAAALRRRLRAGESIDDRIPPEAAAVYARARAEGRGPADPAALEIALLSRLRMLGEEEFSSLPDAGDGLGRRLYRAVQEESGWEEILSAAKSKRYALARLRRMALGAALGVTGEGMPDLPPYARVLAFDRRGRELLRARAEGGLPLLVKPAKVRSLSEDCQRVFRLGASAHDLYVLGLSGSQARKPGGDWRSGPVFCE